MHYRESSFARRARLSQRIHQLLTQRFMLRAHMSLIVLLTSAAAFGASRALRSLGVDAMYARYAAATTVAYGVFLGLFHLWLWYFREVIDDEIRPDAEGLSRDEPRPGAEPSRPRRSGAHVDLIDVGVGLDHPPASAADSAGEGVASGLSGVDGEGAAVVVIVVAVVLIAVAILGVAGWMIWEAPMLFAEALIDVVISSAIARSRRELKGDPRGRGVFRATWWVYPVVLVVACGGALAVQHVCPRATTMGQAIELCVLD